MNIGAQLRPAIMMVVVFTVLVGLIYPLTITGIAQVLFPYQANGSLLTNSQGKVVGSALIGQNFSGPQYFHPRPSAAGPNGYNAAASGGSNLGPTNKQLIADVQQRAIAYRKENGLAPNAPVPVDAVTSSASGLDPDISVANAMDQVHRVATARGLSDTQVTALVNQYTQGRILGILGEPVVNVLELNRALNALK